MYLSEELTRETNHVGSAMKEEELGRIIRERGNSVFTDISRGISVISHKGSILLWDKHFSVSAKYVCDSVQFCYSVFLPSPSCSSSPSIWYFWVCFLISYFNFKFVALLKLFICDALVQFRTFNCSALAIWKSELSCSLGHLLVASYAFSDHVHWDIYWL